MVRDELEVVLRVEADPVKRPLASRYSVRALPPEFDRVVAVTMRRPAAGGPQLKGKFVVIASFVVAGRKKTRRSVALELHDERIQVLVGNVTIPPNHAIPKMGTVIEARYLYAHRESGSIYQPVYLGERSDIPAEDCTVDQLKYKAEPAGGEAV